MHGNTERREEEKPTRRQKEICETYEVTGCRLFIIIIFFFFSFLSLQPRAAGQRENIRQTDGQDRLLSSCTYVQARVQFFSFQLGYLAVISRFNWFP